ncbi:MAG TPA: glycoside hydrolase family 44 protein [Chloroflexia bacterium]|nr:glycoside hydrolase family 44 protein [Chloroflexia bacterium]
MKLRVFSCLCLLCALTLTACSDNPKPPLEEGAPATITTGLPTPVFKVLTPSPQALTPRPVATPAPSPTPITDQRVLSGDLVVLQLDPSKPKGDISPYIYGLAGLDPKNPDYGTSLKPGLIRWGGNPNTTYNWVLGNAWNNGRDNVFENTDYGFKDQDVATNSITQALQLKAAMLLTIPTIGWVANGNNNVRSQNVPDEGGAPVAPGADAIKGYDPAANRALTSVKSEARKNAPFVLKPDPKSPVVYQDEWVNSLVKKFGPANAGGVKFYAMDNEPDLWSETHTDIHPTRMGYDDMLSNFVEYASAVKDVDPTAQITGPVVWGWTNYFYSALDRGDDNFKTALDQKNHGYMPFLPWFLEQLKQYEQKNGRRLLDVMDIHYYPQAKGVQSDATDPKTAALRLRSTRSLWDDSYVDESWIGTQVRLIPRMKEWINTYYPGTKLGITEWNWGADGSMNGALAISQVLGIFGREGVDMAAYWRYPPSDSPGFYAFKMYTNFDNKGSSFGDKSVPVSITDNDKISSFAALDSKTGHLRLIVVNQQPDRDQNIEIQLPQNIPAQAANVYQLSSKTGSKLAQLNSLNLTETNRVTVTVPAYSATLLDLALPSR